MKQPWIRSLPFDLLWFIAPAVLPVIIVIAFPGYFSSQALQLSTTSWIVLILLVDVAHVYSTVYRTYFNKTAIKKFSFLFKLTPFVCWGIGILLYSINDLFFWRCLAYLAVFHFIRQQYGFLRIYSRNETIAKWFVIIHKVTIYGVTLLPILIWHAQGQKNFNWFVEGDFIYFNSPFLVALFKFIFYTLLLIYFLCEGIIYKKHKLFNLPRILLVCGTALSWYVGIVVYNGDLVFTMLNVLAHGIPYMALIWVSEKSTAQQNQPGIIKHFFKAYGVVLFIGLLIVFAYVEEGLWDSLVWREHNGVFNLFYFLSPVQHPKFLAFLVPLLSLPQIVHYVLDGFIWRRNKSEKEVII